jgi:hypothetical protein
MNFWQFRNTGFLRRRVDMARLVVAVAAVFIWVPGAWAMQSMQRDFQRVGIGLASLAEKECPGYRKGAAMQRVFDALGAVTPEQQATLLAEAEGDARDFLRAQGKELCAVAADFAKVPGSLIERTE